MKNPATESTSLMAKSSLLKDSFQQKSTLGQFTNSITEIKNSPRDYWLLLLSKFGNFAGFSLLSLSATVFVIEVQNFSDIDAGIINILLGFFGVLYSIVFGYFPDHYGIRFSLILCNIVGCAGFVLLINVNNKYAQLCIILSLILISVTISIPATKLAVKQYTNDKSISMGYSLYYLVYYGSAAVAGLLIDYILSKYGQNLNSFRLIFGISAFLLFGSALVSAFLREVNRNPPENENFMILENTSP